MTVKASGMLTITDLNDAKQLSVYVASNLPKIQIKDTNGATTYEPNWTSTNVILTPTIMLNNEALSLASPDLLFNWKRKEGISTETVLTTGETVSNGVLTINQNKMAGMTSNQLTYICYITYTDPYTLQTSNVAASFDFSLINNASNAKVISIVGEQVFKYDKDGVIVGATQISLTGNAQGVTISKWQYKNASSVFVDYPTTGDNANITSGTLIVKPAHAVFFNNTAVLRLITSDANVTDTITITKLYDGITGNTGSTGADAVSIIITNEAQIVPTNTAGTTTSAQTILVKIIAYKGTTKITPTLTTPTGLPSGMTASQATASQEVTLTLSIASGATLGGVDLGTINLAVVADGKSFTKLFAWAKSKQGVQGNVGQNAVVFSVYAPNGTVILNGSGSLPLETVGYDGSTKIVSGATYQWSKYISGSWTNISGATTATYTALAVDIINQTSFRCTMIYATKTYVDTITLLDKTDSFTSQPISLGGEFFKNGQGESIIYARLFQNGAEVDALKSTNLSNVAPTSPVSGTFWYKVDKTAKTVVLQKYSGSAWANATGGDLHTNTYNWYRRDKDGNALDGGAIFKTGKVIFVNDTDVDVKATFILEVV